MNITSKNVFSKICAIIVIFALTLSDFLLVGQAVVSYAIDAVHTNNANVDFSAYFLDAKGEKTTYLEEKIDKGEEFLFVDVSVKNEGYFNGKIKLNNSNFNIKENIVSDYVKNISANEVILNQINAGSTVTIKLAIEPVKLAKITKNVLNCETSVVLNGQYVNSKNVESEKYIEIVGNTKVSCSWISSDKTQVELDSKLLTNSVYKLGEEENRLVQILVNSRITNNNYPVKNTNIVLSVPKNIKDVSVFARSNDATNKDIEFSNSNYVYDKNNGKLTISVSNEDENNISWADNAYDSFVISYLLEKEENIQNTEISVNEEITTYDNKKLSATQNVHIDKEIDGIVNFEITPVENNIYKGKLYTGEERDYTINSKIFVDYINANKIELKENKAVYVINNSEIEAGIRYKEIVINKNEFLNLFGKDGFITIKDENGAVIANIKSTSEINELGDIHINNISNVKAIQLETSKPLKIGSISIKAVKTIVESKLSRDTINQIGAIKESIAGKYDENTEATQTKQIELKNTTSKATFDVGASTLSALETNKNIKITTVLFNSNESYDLYKNPTVKIIFPNQVKKVENIRIDTLYKNGLEDREIKTYTENGRQVIEIGLNGEQKTYNKETLEGTTIIVYTDIEVDRLATNSEEEFSMKFTNEYASTYENDGEIKKNIKIATENSLLATNSIKDLNIETIGNKGTVNAYLELDKEQKEYTVDFDLINNEGSTLSGVEVLGRFPTSGNLGAKVISNIAVSSDAKVYYSKNEKATSSMTDSNNAWSENRMDDAKSFLIRINKINVNEKIEASYKLSIPANLTYNKSAETGYTVSYLNELTGNSNTISSTNINLTTGTGAEIVANLKAYIAGNEIKDGDIVNAGEKIKYELTLKNDGTEEAKNVAFEASIPNGTKCVKYVKSTETGNDNQNITITDSTTLYGAEDYYKDIEIKDNKITSTLEKLAVNDEKTFIYEIETEQESVNTKISSDVKVKYIGNANSQNYTERKSNIISNNINSSEVKAELVMISRGTDYVYSGEDYAYKLKVTNTVAKRISNLNVEIKTNAGYEVTNLSDGIEKLEFTNNKFNISSLDAGETKIYEIDVIATGKEKISKISTIVNNMYRSNECSEEIELVNVAVSMKSENEGQSINNGDSVEYNISIKNNGTDSIDKVSVIQKVPNPLDVAEVKINGNNIQYDTQYLNTSDDENDETQENKIVESDNYKIGFVYEEQVKPGESIEFIVSTKSNSEYMHKNDIQLSSSAEISVKNVELKSEEINHILKANVGEEPIGNDEFEYEKPTQIAKDPEAEENYANTPNSGNENGENPTQSPSENQNPGSNSEQQTVKEETYVISGTAWLDENEDGERNSSEITLSGINVRLIDLQNNTSQNTTTSSKGFYSFNNVKNGKYVAVFEYDTEKYVLTKYRAKDIAQSRNSDVENVTMNIDGTSNKVASTDTLTVENSGITNIDIGLIEAKVFDLKLSKTISKVSISNSQGTENKEYNDANIAKMEIKAKYISGTTVAVEYKIKVTNNGELAGYARNIVDYKPSDLNFNSKLNPDWYQSGDYLYSTALANTKIEAGETKELTLVLTKTMTENNTGLTNNTAEIADAYNTLGVEDINSTPNNRNAKENDQDGANLIISVSTGAAVSYISITLSIIAVIAVGAYIVARKVLKASIKI